MSKKMSSGSKIVRFMKAPLRALGKARDFYVKSMTSCAGNMGSGLYPNTLPKSFSVASSRISHDDEDMQEVMRMVTQKSLREKVEAAAGRQPTVTGSNGLPKSFSVAIGRIDEDKPCYFEENVKLDTNVVYPRSKSYAVTKRRSEMFIS